MTSVDKGAGAVDDVPRTGVFWTRQEITDWLNECDVELWSEVAQTDGKSLLTDTDGAYAANSRSVSLQTLLGVSDDPLEILEVRDVTGVAGSDPGVPIPFMEHIEFGQWHTAREPVSATRLRPGRGWTYGGYAPMRIELFPVPTSAVTLRVRYVPAVPVNPVSGTAPALRADTADDATGDADVPLAVPAALHGLYVLYAVVQAKQKEESDWRPEWTLYQEKLARFRESAEERQSQGSRRTLTKDGAEFDFGFRRRTLGLL